MHNAVLIRVLELDAADTCIDLTAAVTTSLLLRLLVTKRLALRVLQVAICTVAP